MSIVLQGSTSGSVTLQEPAIAGTTVLDLPAVSGTIITTGSSGQSIPKAALPTGSVLQVVSSIITSAASTTGTSYVATNVLASITPTSASSKILILSSIWCSASATAQNTVLTLYRGGTDIVGTSYGLGSIYSGAGGVEGMIGSCWLDSPNTTSSTTYTFYVRRADAAGTATAGSSARTSQITLMEIAA